MLKQLNGKKIIVYVGNTKNNSAQEVPIHSLPSVVSTSNLHHSTHLNQIAVIWYFSWLQDGTAFTIHVECLQGHKFHMVFTDTVIQNFISSGMLFGIVVKINGAAKLLVME